MSTHSLLPLRGLVITLRCTATARLAFFHQPALTAFLRFLAGSPEAYDQFIRIDAPESGRISYRAGEHYRFLLLGLAGSDALLDALLSGLAGLPQSAPKQGEGLPFADNWRLAAVQDMFTGNPVTCLEEACCYDTEALQAEVALWKGKQQVQWQWLSPALLLKDKQQREADGIKAKGEARYVRDAPDLSGALLCSRLHTGVADLLRRRGEAQAMPLTTAQSVAISAAHLFWLEAGYRGADHQQREMGGVSGHVQLQLPANLPLAWWELLVLGQYVGVGQRTTFGWGRYLLVDADGGQSYRRVFPASSLLMLAQDADNLSRAWDYVQAGQDIPAGLADEPEVARWYQSDDEEDDAEGSAEDALDAPTDELPLARLQADLERLLEGSYQPPAVQGYWLPKASGGMHLLNIAPLHDRVLQRAVQQVLAETLGALLAAQRDAAVDDRQDCFHPIDLERLRERLVAIYHNDPVVEAILGWLRAEVVCDGETVTPTQGLPLGSPLSPLLARLMRDAIKPDIDIHIGQRERTGTFVTVTGDPAVLTTANGQLHVYRKDELLMQLPWNSIQTVLLLGNHQVTMQAMHTALDHDIPIHLASGKGNYKGCITHNRSSQHQSLWVQQILAFQDEAKVLACAKEVVFI